MHSTVTRTWWQNCRTTTIASPIPTPGANPSEAQAIVVPATSIHSQQVSDAVDSHSACNVSSVPMNSTRADAWMVGT